MSPACEPFEIQISTLLDRELDRQEQLETVDHLVRCASCRDFYREARALDGLARAVATTGLTAPAELWSAIEGATAPRRRRTATWLLRVAAVIVLTLGVGFLLSYEKPDHSPPPSSLAKHGPAAEEMSEAHFVEITRQVLGSDRRYQRAMLQVMNEVLATVPTTEGGGEPEEAGESAGERDLGRA